MFFRELGGLNQDYSKYLMNSYVFFVLTLIYLEFFMIVGDITFILQSEHKDYFKERL
jgi:hypothetical protein